MATTLFHDNFVVPTDGFRPLSESTPEVGSWIIFAETATLKLPVISSIDNPLQDRLTRFRNADPDIIERALTAPMQTINTSDFTLTTLCGLGPIGGGGAYLYGKIRIKIGADLDNPFLNFAIFRTAIDSDPIITTTYLENITDSGTQSILVPYDLVPAKTGGHEVKLVSNNGTLTVYVEGTQLMVSELLGNVPLGLISMAIDFEKPVIGTSWPALSYGLYELLLEQGAVAPISFWENRISTVEQL